MSLVRLENITKTFAGDPVLQGVNLRIEEGERIGLIGRNGTGKSTIFRVITGETEPDSGTVDRMRKARIAVLRQLHNHGDDETIQDIVMRKFSDITEMEVLLAQLEERMSHGDEAALDEYAHVQDEFSTRGGYDFRYRIKRVLMGLGFLESEFELPFKALSGGQRTRLMLALVLLEEADLLLLDEPENHLDLEAREWLEDYLKECRRAFMIISHDRQMLNAVAERVIELERGEVRSYKGNYDGFVEAKALWIEQQQAAYERQQDHIRKQMVFIDRFRYKATKSRQVQSRLKQLDKLEVIENPVEDNSKAKFNLGEIVRSGALALEAKGLTMGYGDLPLYSNVSFTVERGERVGIIGPNGAGKSTLLRQIAGKIKGLAGEVTLGNKTVMAYYEQNHESVNPVADILSEVHSAKTEWKPEQVRTFLGRFLFTGDDVYKKIGTLSGGELSRVAMAKMILSGPNLIMLDEPTNHLDIVSREALEEAISEFPGSVIVISHDRTLIDRLVDKLIIIENGSGSVHLGNYSHYKWKRGESKAAEDAKKATEDVLRIRRAESAKPVEKGEAQEIRSRRRQAEKAHAAARKRHRSDGRTGRGL
jgi:ATP-binding cassette subfamily F protein 3